MTFDMRTSERSTLKRCPQKWYWSIVEGLEPLRAANPLWFGQGVHVGLADWYQHGAKRGPHPAITFQKFVEGDRQMRVRPEYPEDAAEYVSAVELGVNMLEEYVKDYGKDDNWDVIATEMTFQVWFHYPGTRKKWFRYVGTWDGVYRDRSTGEIWLMEHKTAAAIDTSHLPLDDQAGSYQAFANRILRKRGILKPGERIAGVMYNFLRKQMKDTRPQDPSTGLYCNKPTKDDYIAAINAERMKMPNKKGGSWLGPELTGKEKLEDLQLIARKMDLTVYGPPSARQPASYRHREPVYRSKHEELAILQRIRNEAIFIEGYRNANPLYPLTKTPSQFGALACSHCQFFRMCQLHEQGDMESVEDFKATLYNIRDPYADHEIKAA